MFILQRIGTSNPANDKSWTGWWITNLKLLRRRCLWVMEDPTSHWRKPRSWGGNLTDINTGSALNCSTLWVDLSFTSNFCMRFLSNSGFGASERVYDLILAHFSGFLISGCVHFSAFRLLSQRNLPWESDEILLHVSYSLVISLIKQLKQGFYVQLFLKNS